MQTAWSCSSSATSALCPASPQWNFLYKDTSLCSPINQAAEVHGLRYSACVCVFVCVTHRKSREEHEAPRGSLWTTSQGQGHRKEGDAKVNPSAGSRAREGDRGPDGEWDKQDTERQSSRYTEQRGLSLCHIRTVALGWNLGSFLCYFQSRVQLRSPSPSD